MSLNITRSLKSYICDARNAWISQSKKKLIRIRIVDIGNSDKYLALEYEYNKEKFKEEQKIVVTMSNMNYIDMINYYLLNR